MSGGSFLDRCRSSVQRTLEGRLPRLVQFGSLLELHDIAFPLDTERFLHDRLYAAWVFQVETRLLEGLQAVVDGALPLAGFRDLAGQFRVRPGRMGIGVAERASFNRTLTEGAPVALERLGDVSAWLRQGGQAEAVAAGAGLVLVGKVISGDGRIHNYSDERHLFTVNVDLVVDRPVKTAEAISHETAHNLLNCFLEAEGIQLADAPLRWYSPWTQSLRHHRGIVHGFFAFTAVARFYRSLDVPEHRRQVEAYLEMQRRNLRSVEPSLREILPDYPPNLTSLIEDAYREVA
jgi:hypothetical protein